MGAGRPTVLTPELISAANYYVDSTNDVLYEDGLKRGEIKEVNLVSVEGLALSLGVHKATLYRWKEESKEEDSDALSSQLSDVLERLANKQAKQLINKGMQGVYTPVMAKMMLSKHGYIEKSDITSGDKPIAPSEESSALVAAALNQFLKKETPDANTPRTSADGK